MRRLILVRHGESLANRAGTFDGHADAALTELGREQARMAGALLASLGLGHVRLLSSPLQRAMHTAEQIGAALRVDCAVDARLLAGEGRAGQALEGAGVEVAAALEAAYDGWDGAVVAVSHRFPIRGYLQTLYGAQTAEALVNGLGNGDALDLVLEAGVPAEPDHHRLQRGPT